MGSSTLRGLAGMVKAVLSLEVMGPCLFVAVLAVSSPTPTRGADGVVLQAASAKADTLAAVKTKAKGKAKGKGKKRQPVVEITGKDATGEAPSVPTPAATPPTGSAPGPLPEPRPLPKNYLAVAVLPLNGSDVGFELVHEVENALLNEVDETKGMRAISPGDVSADTGAINLDPSRCNGELACLARAGLYAGAHLAIDARVAALGGVLSVSARIIDTRSSVELGRVAESLADDPTQRAGELHHLAVQLLTPDAYVGSLKIKCSQDAAEVFLDDKLIGTTPMSEGLKSLRAGPHILRVTKSGFADLYQFVDVVFNRSSTIEVDLSTTTLVGVMVESESQTGLGELFVIAREPGIEVRIDGEPKGSTPFATPIVGIPAGKRRISLRKEGTEPLVREVDIVAGKRTDMLLDRQGATLVSANVAVVETSAPLPQSAAALAASSSVGAGPTPLATDTVPPGPTWRTYSGVAAAGAGVLGLVAGGVFALRVSGLNADARAQVAHLKLLSGNTYSCTDLSQQACQDRATKLKQIADRNSQAQSLEAIGFIAGGSLLIAGGALFTWDYVRQQPVAIYAVPTPGGALAGVAAQF